MPPASVALGGKPEPTTWATVGAEVLDVERQHLVEQGWGIGLTDVPVVAGWSVRIRAGRFVGIRRAGGSDDYWTAPDPTLMPEAW